MTDEKVKKLIPAVQEFAKSACALADHVLEVEEQKKEAVKQTVEELIDLGAIQLDEQYKEAAIDTLSEDHNTMCRTMVKLGKRGTQLEDKLLQSPIGEGVKNASAEEDLESDQIYTRGIDNLSSLM